MKHFLKTVFFSIVFLAACGGPSSPTAEGPIVAEEHSEKLWVATERLNRRTCASETCGIVGKLFFREGVTPLEEQNGWVRISGHYSASCEGGINEYVDEGNTACTEENGIVDGSFAEWVEKSYLSQTRQADPAKTAAANETLVAQSDDFARYRKAFASLAARLIAEGRCSEADLREQGGFMKSVNDYPGQPVYFTYCGGMTLANKVYVNAETGEVLN